jgi:large subunit ribosomal protein L25
MLSLTVKKRDPKQPLKAIRKNGVFPAVFYGPKQESTPILVSHLDFMKAYKQAGESTVITLTGVGEEHEALIHEIDFHPVTGVPRHADFYVIEKGKKVQVNVPLEFTGEAAAVKDLGGTLVKVLHEVEIEALPKDLPHNLTVDISPLVAFDSQVLAKDIVLPSGVTLMSGPEEVVASVYQTVEEPVEAAPVDISSIEISEERGKKEEEGEAGAPAAEAKSEKAEKSDKK